MYTSTLDGNLDETDRQALNKNSYYSVQPNQQQTPFHYTRNERRRSSSPSAKSPTYHSFSPIIDDSQNPNSKKVQPPPLSGYHNPGRKASVHPSLHPTSEEPLQSVSETTVYSLDMSTSPNRYPNHQYNSSYHNTPHKPPDNDLPPPLLEKLPEFNSNYQNENHYQDTNYQQPTNTSFDQQSFDNQQSFTSFSNPPSQIPYQDTSTTSMGIDLGFDLEGMGLPPPLTNNNDDEFGLTQTKSDAYKESANAYQPSIYQASTINDKQPTNESTTKNYEPPKASTNTYQPPSMPTTNKYEAATNTYQPPNNQQPPSIPTTNTYEAIDIKNTSFNEPILEPQQSTNHIISPTTSLLPNNLATPQRLSTNLSWKIPNFSTLPSDKLVSPVFGTACSRFQAIVYPQGAADATGECISVYLRPVNQTRKEIMHFSVYVRSSNDEILHDRLLQYAVFDENTPAVGWNDYLPIKDVSGVLSHDGSLELEVEVCWGSVVDMSVQNVEVVLDGNEQVGEFNDWKMEIKPNLNHISVHLHPIKTALEQAVGKAWGRVVTGVLIKFVDTTNGTVHGCKNLTGGVVFDDENGLGWDDWLSKVPGRDIREFMISCTVFGDEKLNLHHTYQSIHHSFENTLENLKKLQDELSFANEKLLSSKTRLAILTELDTKNQALLKDSGDRIKKQCESYWKNEIEILKSTLLDTQHSLTLKTQEYTSLSERMMDVKTRLFAIRTRMALESGEGESLLISDEGFTRANPNPITITEYYTVKSELMAVQSQFVKLSDKFQRVAQERKRLEQEIDCTNRGKSSIVSRRRSSSIKEDDEEEELSLINALKDLQTNINIANDTYTETIHSLPTLTTLQKSDRVAEIVMALVELEVANTAFITIIDRMTCSFNELQCMQDSELSVSNLVIEESGCIPFGSIEIVQGDVGNARKGLIDLFVKMTDCYPSQPEYDSQYNEYNQYSNTYTNDGYNTQTYDGYTGYTESQQQTYPPAQDYSEELMRANNKISELEAEVLELKSKSYNIPPTAPVSSKVMKVEAWVDDKGQDSFKSISKVKKSGPSLFYYINSFFSILIIITFIISSLHSICTLPPNQISHHYDISESNASILNSICIDTGVSNHLTKIKNQLDQSWKHLTKTSLSSAEWVHDTALPGILGGVKQAAKQVRQMKKVAVEYLKYDDEKLTQPPPSPTPAQNIPVNKKTGDKHPIISEAKIDSGTPFDGVKPTISNTDTVQHMDFEKETAVKGVDMNVVVNVTDITGKESQTFIKSESLVSSVESSTTVSAVVTSTSIFVSSVVTPVVGSSYVSTETVKSVVESPTIETGTSSTTVSSVVIRTSSIVSSGTSSVEKSTETVKSVVESPSVVSSIETGTSLTTVSSVVTPTSSIVGTPKVIVESSSVEKSTETVKSVVESPSVVSSIGTSSSVDPVVSSASSIVSSATPSKVIVETVKSVVESPSVVSSIGTSSSVDPLVSSASSIVSVVETPTKSVHEQVVFSPSPIEVVGTRTPLEVHDPSSITSTSTSIRIPTTRIEAPEIITAAPVVSPVKAEIPVTRLQTTVEVELAETSISNRVVESASVVEVEEIKQQPVKDEGVVVEFPTTAIEEPIIESSSITKPTVVLEETEPPLIIESTVQSVDETRTSSVTPPVSNVIVESIVSSATDEKDESSLPITDVEQSTIATTSVKPDTIEDVIEEGKQEERHDEL